MDLARVPNERKLYLCRWYFRVGFILLPMVWAVNAVWFFNEAFRKPQYEEQGPIKKYVIFSTIGAVMWIVAFIGWITIFLQNRVAWGEFADDISILIPTGSS